ncbi:MAG: DUF4157 domain-containing protein, partial [Bacteroidota bacterium]
FFSAAPKPRIQAKLTVNQPGDAYEKEADAMADQVVRMKSSGKVAANMETEEPQLQTKSATGRTTVQRKCAACEPEETIQPKAVNAPVAQASTHVENQLKRSKGKGEPLPKTTKTQMESGFGADFSKVRVHTDTSAIQMNQSLNAQAFTHGSDIYFGAGKYQPGSTEGDRLLAHELTHTIQQGATVKRKTKPESAAQQEEQKAPASGVSPKTTSSAKVTSPRSTPQAVMSQIMRSISKVNPMISRSMVPQIQLRANVRYAPTDINCIAMDTLGTPGALNVLFDQDVAALSGPNQLLIENFVGSWVARGLSDDLLIGGFASKEGGQTQNWRLSCDRAEAVQAELVRIGVPANKITTFAHGETEDFSAAALEPNRRATVDFTPGVGPIINPNILPNDNFAGRSLNRFGIAELLSLNYLAAPHIQAAEHFGLRWVSLIGSGRIFPNPLPAFSARYIAGNNPGTEIVALQVTSGPATGTILMTAAIPLIAPTFSNMVQRPGDGVCHRNGVASVGFRGDMFMQPNDVSFMTGLLPAAFGLRWREGTGTMMAVNSLSAFNGTVHTPTAPPINIGAGNFATGNQILGSDTVTTGHATADTGFLGLGKPDWSGAFIWPIEWQYIAPGATPVTYMTAFQVASIDAAGTASIFKVNSGVVTRALGAPTNCFTAPFPVPDCC